MTCFLSNFPHHILVSVNSKLDFVSCIGVLFNLKKKKRFGLRAEVASPKLKLEKERLVGLLLQQAQVLANPKFKFEKQA